MTSITQNTVLKIIYKRPMIPCAILAFVISVVLAIKFSTIYIIFITLLFLAFCCIKYIKSRELLAIVIVLLLVTIKSLISYGRADVINSYSGETLSAQGIVSSIDYYGDANLYEIEIGKSSIKRLSGTKIAVIYNNRALSVGDTVQFYGEIVPLDSQNAQYYYSNGVYSAVDISELSVQKTQNNFYRICETIRTKIRSILFSNTSFDTATTLNALLIGDKSYLSEEYNDAVRKSGVSHMLVVSGMHMVIICGTVLKILCFVFLNRRLASCFTFVIGLCFMAVCGFTPSVMRAGIMYMVMLFAAFLFKKSDSLNSLCFSVIILIYMNPFITQNVGFLLSVFATAGIIVLSDPLTDRLIKGIKSRLLKTVISSVVVTVSATVTTLPIMIFYFHGVSIVAVITNLLISFFINGALLLSLLGVAVFYLPYGEILCKPILTASELAVRYSNEVIYLLGNFKYAYIDLEPVFNFLKG